MLELRSRLLALSLLLCTSCVWEQANAYNVDTREPIFRQSPTVLNGENVEDYFGFAVALHQVEEVQAGDDMMTVATKTRIIVGAPKGTFPGGLSLTSPGVEPPIERTGLIYSCNITSGIWCDAVRGDEGMFLDGDEVDNDYLNGAGRFFDHRPNAVLETSVTRVVAEDKENQLMGATLFSTGDTFVACAPAWTTTGRYDPSLSRTSTDNQLSANNRLPKGRCYFTQRDLTQLTYLDPCNSAMDTNDVRRNVGQSYCTSGTDVTIISRGAEPRVFVIGVPGYDEGKGALAWGANQGDMENRGQTDTGIGNIEHINSSGLLSEILETRQGFQVTSGYVTEPRDVDGTNPPPNVLTSAPRFDNSVYLGKVDIYDTDDIQQLSSVTAEGIQIADYFGYALETADLNGDRYDDVIVGAPFYSRIGPRSVQEELGRVYVFMNTQGALSAEPLVFQGSVPRGRFGMSLLSLGDIDRDGYEDIAVGAPYEVNEDTENTGAVYIYYGHRNWTIFEQQTPTKIAAQDIANELDDVQGLATFGFSLAGRVDVDDNGYNDLVIGAFESKAVVVLRSLPVADVDVELTAGSNEIRSTERSCDIGGTFYTCFYVWVAANYSGLGLSGPQDVTVVLSENRSSSEQRIFFQENTELRELSLTLQLNPSDTQNITVYILDGIIDTVSPLVLVATVQQNDLPDPGTSDDGNPAIRDLDNDFRIRLPDPATAEVRFINNCGVDDVCQTDISLQLSNNTEYLPSGRGYTSIEQGGVREVRFTLTISNDGAEDAIGLFLDVTHDRSELYSESFNVTGGNDVIQCRSPCRLSRLGPGEERVLLVTLSVQSEAVVGMVETTFNLTSNQIEGDDKANNYGSIVLTVERRADLQVTASFTDPDTIYMKQEPENVRERSDVGSRVSMEVEVSNVGSTTVGTASLRIYYPASSSVTGNFFFLLPDCSVKTDALTTCDSSAFQRASELPCNGGSRKKRHTISPVVKQRRRNAKATVGEAALKRNAHRRTTRQDSSAQTAANSLNCRTNPENCLLITCEIRGLQGQGANSAKVTLAGYVDERFFADQSGDYQLTAFATVSFNETSEETTDDQEEPDEDDAPITVRQQETGGGGDDDTNIGQLLYSIIPAIVAAIILLVVLFVVLYFCGFFRRKKQKKIQEAEGDFEQEPEKKSPDEATQL